MSKRLTLIVLGMMGSAPYASQAWMYVNWLRGLAGLGHDVYYVEDDTVWPYDPEADTVSDDCGYAVRHIAHTMTTIGLGDRWAFRLADREGACWGMSERALRQLYERCDALLHICGGTELREDQLLASPRVYVETDPGAVELRIANGDRRAADAFADHHLFASYAESYGSPSCAVPLDGRQWVPTRQPVDLELWPMVFDPNARFFTTIGNYRQNEADVEWEGSTYHWSKHHAWERFIELPAKTRQEFELALTSYEDDDRERLLAAGWRLTSPFAMSWDVFGAYPSYIAHSRGEFTVAKDQYVRLGTGWFSERAVCYLACGKPVVTQETGFSNVLPTGAGLFAVADVDQAAAAVDQINADYRDHCEAARAIAVEHFEARGVAARLLEGLGLA